MAIIILCCIIIILVILVIATYNSLIKQRNMVQEAFSTMDVYLKKRWDLIPNLVETVKGYAAHEKTLLEETVKLRNLNYNSMGMNDKMEASHQLSASLGRLFAVSENYPALKANENFMDLGKQLQAIENDIAVSRKYYNAVVRQYNNKAETFPNNLIAALFGFSRMQMFEMPDNEKGNVPVHFS